MDADDIAGHGIKPASVLRTILGLAEMGNPDPIENVFGEENKSVFDRLDAKRSARFVFWKVVCYSCNT